MVNLIYVSHNDVSFDLHDFASAKLEKANFHKVSWVPETIQKQYGTVVNRFTKNAQTFDCTFKFKNDPDQRKTQIDDLIFQTESDIANNSPGRIYWNNQYIDVFLCVHDCHPVDSGMTWTEVVGQFYAPFPFWIEEKNYQIDPDEDFPGYFAPDVKGYPSDRNISYAYTYSYPLSGNSGTFTVDSPLESDFRAVIYGPVNSQVRIIIDGSNYQVNYPLRMGQKMVVDSRDILPISKKCYVINEDASTTNVFDYRDPNSLIFKKIPPGTVNVTFAEPYKVDFTLFQERSAPK